MSASTTRRGFLAGAIAGAAAPALARAPTAAASSTFVQAKRKTVFRGRAIAVAPGGRRIVVAHASRRTIAIHDAGAQPRLIDVGGQPLELAVSPDGRHAAVTTASWDEPGLAVVDLSAAALVGRLDVGPAPFDVAFSPDGRRAIVSGGEQEGTVHVIDTQSWQILTRTAVGRVPRAIAPSPNSRRAWIALNGEDRIVAVNLKSGRTGRSVRTARLPDRVAVSADGRRLLVSHGGRNSSTVSEIVLAGERLRRHHAGRLPSAVAWTRKGHRLVALGGGGEVVVFARKGRTFRHRVGGAPRGLAVAGKRAYTVDNLSGEIRRVRA